MAVGAIAKRDGIGVTQDAVEGYLEGLSEKTGTPMQELVDAVKKDTALQKTLSEKLLYVMTVEYVISQADLRFDTKFDDGPPDGF